jgi:hypothetical protein
MRCEAAELRRDINEAQILIDRLQRSYLNDDGPAFVPGTGMPCLMRTTPSSGRSLLGFEAVR